MNDRVSQCAFARRGNGWEGTFEFLNEAVPGQDGYGWAIVSIDSHDLAIVEVCTFVQQENAIRATAILTVPIVRMEVERRWPNLLFKIFTSRDGESTRDILQVAF